MKMGRNYFPFSIEDEARKVGGHFVSHPAPLAPFAIQDGNLITDNKSIRGLKRQG